MPASRFQEDRKNAPEAFSVYNPDFQNSTYFPIVFPSGRKYAILVPSRLTFWLSDTLPAYHTVQARHSERNISASSVNEQKREAMPSCVHTISCGPMTARLAAPSPPSPGATGRKPCRAKRFCAQ